MNEIIVLIPAYNPDKILIEIVEELKKYYKIIVINDGSDPEYKKIFDEVSKSVILKTHESNCGKGEAIKTGIRECIKQNWDIKGIITVDADGQHSIEDVKKVGNQLERYNCIILGVRELSKMPIKNKLGNIIVRKIMQLKYKIEITDTQTGLRAIPRRYFNEFNQIKGSRFNYEIEMIKYILYNKEKFKEIKIKTIYNKNNKSKFRVIKDSISVINSCIK